MAKTGRKSGEAESAYHHGSLRSALAREARAIAERQGIEAVSLRAVAQAAGVSQAAPYHHFADKRALLAAVAAEGFCEFSAHMTRRRDEAAEPVDRLLKIGVGYVEFALRHPLLFRLMQGPVFQGTDVPADLAGARDGAYAVLADAVAEVLPKADEAERARARAAAWSMVHGLAILANDGRLRLENGTDPEAAVETILELLAIDRPARPSVPETDARARDGDAS